MKLIERILLIFLSFQIIASCISAKKSHNSIGDYNRIVGLWTEHWGQESDVNYVDTIKIELKKNGDLNLRCINNANYLYDRIDFTNDKLTFRMENTSDSNERFLIDYSLQLMDGEKLLQGEIVNSRGARVKVSMVKIK